MTDLLALHSGTLHPIARIHTPYQDKFGVPRQPGLSPSTEGVIELLPPFDDPHALVGLEAFSHLWLIWLFDRNPQGQSGPEGWRPRVRPPRLGGNDKLGVFATRSPFRPNPIGLSAVEIIEVLPKQTQIRVRAADLVDGTTIIDIKPYVPYADSLPDAQGGFARLRPEARLTVSFSAEAQHTLDQQANPKQLTPLIRENIALDPRPSFHTDKPERLYHLRLDAWDIHFQVQKDQAMVVQINAI